MIDADDCDSSLSEGVEAKVAGLEEQLEKKGVKVTFLEEQLSSQGDVVTCLLEKSEAQVECNLSVHLNEDPSQLSSV